MSDVDSLGQGLDHRLETDDIVTTCHTEVAGNLWCYSLIDLIRSNHHLTLRVNTGTRGIRKPQDGQHSSCISWPRTGVTIELLSDYC